MTTPGAQNTPSYQPLRAPRGSALSCKGWQQEAVLRMLLNCLDPDVAERPQDLLISGAAGGAAADRESVQSAIASLRQLENTETLRIESGRLTGVPQTKPLAPRVLATNVADGEAFGDWLYASTQSALPVLYEIYAAAARRHFGSALAGKLIVGAGMGGAGGAQPLAAALNGAAFLGIEADAERIKRRVKSGYCEVMVNNLDEALRILKNAVRQGKSVSIGLIGNCAALFPELAQRGIVPDVLTDFTPSQPPFGGYIPADAVSSQDSISAQLRSLRDLEKLGTHVVTSTQAFDYLRPLFDDGLRLSTWMALSGEPADITWVDRLALALFPGNDRLQRWLAIAGKYVRFQGLPARVAWLKQCDLSELARAANDLVMQGEISAPLLFGRRDSPTETPNGATAGVDPVENGSCWAWIGSANPENSVSFLTGPSARAIVADGTTDSARRLSAWA